MIKKNFLLIFIFIFSITNASTLENKIILKIDNEIITSSDVVYEIRYLSALNKEIEKLNDNEIYEIAKSSSIREKIKEIEILRNIKEIKIDEEYLNEIIRRTYLKLGINSIDNFYSYLKKNNLNIDIVKKKLSIEILWNQLIFAKFSNKIKINRQKLVEEIVNENNKKQIKYSLSEKLFVSDNRDELEEKFKDITKTIQEKGFNNAALIHSNSDSANTGGFIGWVDQNSLSPNIKEELLKIKVNDYTDPILVPGGFIILKINEYRESDREINLEKEIDKLTKNKTNNQLNQFSNIYFNKIKRDMNINEL